MGIVSRKLTNSIKCKRFFLPIYSALKRYWGDVTPSYLGQQWAVLGQNCLGLHLHIMMRTHTPSCRQEHRRCFGAPLVKGWESGTFKFYSIWLNKHTLSSMNMPWLMNQKRRRGSKGRKKTQSPSPSLDRLTITAYKEKFPYLDKTVCPYLLHTATIWSTHQFGLTIFLDWC